MLVELASFLFFVFFCFLFTLFVILVFGGMSRFSSDLNCPLSFGIARGSGPSIGRPPSSSILPVVAPSPVAATDVSPIAIGVPAPSADQDRGSNGQSSHVPTGPLNSAQPLINKGKRVADEGLQRKRKWNAGSENKEFETLGEGLMANARRAGHVGEFYNINPNATPEGRIVNLEEYIDHLLIRLCLPLQWLNECLGRDEWRDLVKDAPHFVTLWFAFTK